MAAETFKTAAGTLAWDVAGNWSPAMVPQPGDAVAINAPASGYATVSIAATDPAYTVTWLTLMGAGSNISTDQLSVSGSLTVTMATTLNVATISVQNGGHASLGVIALNGSSGISVGSALAGAAATLTAITVYGSALADIYVASGSATIGTLSGSFDLNVATGGTLAVGTTSGNDSFILQGGALSLATTATSLSDYLEVTTASTVDLTGLQYQQGETVKVTANTGGYIQTYSAAILSAQGTTLFTFASVQPGSSAAGAPVVRVSRDLAGDTLVSIACYTPATLIQTPLGERPAGALRIGDLVTTLGGAAKPIVWIGRRSYAGRFLARQRNLLPVRIGAGALGDGLPRRDLLVSPCHAMLLDGVLVPALNLVNGQSIVQETCADQVDYVHLELAQHDVIFAEGAPSETFVDDDSRTVFHNAAEYAALYGDAPSAEPLFYAPRVEDGYHVQAIRDRLAAVAGRMRRAA